MKISTERAKRLAFMADAFMRAAYDPASGPVKLQILRLSEEECKETDRLVKQINALRGASKTLHRASLSPRVLNEVQRAIYKSAVQAIEVMAAHAISTIGADMTAAFVPGKARKAANAGAFLQMQAPVLAKLFAPENN
ncbi:MAG TPA: hypothetical protein VL625_09720 [Patescibacteria group bacterium]|nr:hypothetical protein [Patescibacteria group bacterium]